MSSMFRPFPLVVSAILGVTSWAAAAVPEAGDSAPRALRRSDVVFFNDNPAMYEPYGCTAVGWGGVAKEERVRLAHEKGVRLYATAIAFRTAFHRVLDFSDDYLDAAARDFAGEPFAVPWLWDHKYKGQPVWWGCTNSPLYHKFLEEWLARSMATGPDGLHIDDYSGTAGSVTWLSGGFCRHCMAGFREYLAKNVPKQKLDELGIRDLKTFDYRQFLLDRGVTPEDYKRKRGSLPLVEEFLDYQVRSNTEYVVAFHKLASKLRGRPVTLSVNSGLNSPTSLAIAPYVSYFCCEVGQNAQTRGAPRHSVYVYKLGDAVDRPLAVMGSGQDHAYIMEHNLPGMVRTWVATAYAFGHAFVAPHRLWCYTKEKGTHWYSGPTEQYAWLFQFVRHHARLLDGYEAVAPVAVIYDNAARRKHRADIEPICLALAAGNVPFYVVIAGDDWLPYRLDAAKLAGFRAVIVPKDTALDAAQQRVIDRVAADGRLVTWPDRQTLDRLVPPPVRIEGSDQVWAVPRAIPGNAAAPAVVHLLGRQYDADKDAVVPQKDLTLHLRRDLFDGREFKQAKLHSPQTEPVTLELYSDAEKTTVKVPELGPWGIVELIP